MKIGDKKVIGGVKYYIDRLIGSGSFKRAFLAYTQNGNPFVIFKQITKTKESTENFNKEIKTMENFYKKTGGKCYPNIICPVYIQKPSFFKSGIIVTNYIPGIDLAEYIIKYKYKPYDIIKITFNLLKAVETLHEKIGFVHLDLKPQNLRINPMTLEIGIIDIGMGCDVSEVSCQDAQQKGTVLYMAPELFKTIPSQTQPQFDVKKVDIWAIGCIIYELVFKKPMLLCMTAKYTSYLNLALYFNESNRKTFEEDKQKCLQIQGRIPNWKNLILKKIILMITEMLNYENNKRPDVSLLLNGYFKTSEKETSQTGGKAQFYGKRSSVMVPIPKNVKRWAEKAFKLKRLGFTGALETGWKRAKQLANNDAIPIEDLRYMRNWYARHRYTSYPGFKDWIDAGKPLDKSWHNKHAILSWVTWGADAGFKWVNSEKVIHLLNSHFDKNYKKIKAIR